MKMHDVSTAFAMAALLTIAGHAHGQGFSDDFNDGDLDGWGSPSILFGQEVDSFLVSAQSGALRMEAVGSQSSQQPEVLFLPLAASELDRDIYRNGSVRFDLDLDPMTVASTLARLDESAGTYVIMLARRMPTGGRIAVAAFENGQNTMYVFQNCDFSFDRLHIEAAWMGDRISIRATNRDTLETESVSGTDTSVLAGGDTGLADTRATPDIFEFGATIDDFWLCPSDVNTDGVLDTRDFVAFLNAWVQGDSLADWDGNGAVNTLDFLAFLNQWAAGC